MKKQNQNSENTSIILTNSELSLFEKHRALEGLLGFIEQINSIVNIEDVLWHLAHHTIRTLNFEDCVLYLFDEPSQLLVQKAAYGPKNPERFEILNPITIKIGDGIVGRTAKERQTIRIADTSKDPSYIVDDNIRFSELSVPIIFRNQLLGVIDSEHSLKNFFTREHQRYVEILASVLASKIALEKNIISLEESVKEKEASQNLSEVYFHISELTHNSQSEEEFYSELRQIIVDQVKTESFFVVLFDKQSQQYSFPYMHDERLGGRLDIAVTFEEMQHSLIAKVIETQKPHIADRSELEIRLKDKALVDEKYPGSKIANSWLAVPFEVNPATYGAIALQSYNESIAFNENDLTFFSFIGQHVSVAIDRTIKDQKLQHQALHDQVTGLANRSLFMDRLEHAHSRAKRKTTPNLAILFIDFDNFKQINDSFGHAAGDQLLQIAAKRMQSQLRESDTLSRIGGDEFAILLEDLDNANFAVTIAQRVLDSVSQSIELSKQPVYSTVSIGIAFDDENSQTTHEMMKNADHAMYRAKRSGKNAIKVYESSLHHAVVYERQIVNELETAIQSDQLLFHYQPIVSLKNLKVVGFEALMRWDHPEKGIISPSEFIQIAEQYELVKAIDQKLLECAAKTVESWQSLSNTPPYLSINISAQRFGDSQFIEELKALFERYKIPPGFFVLEVTEHMLVENISKARLLFHRLKELGVKISLDDFGTGYSSLNYLNQLPFDVIKIDRSFVANIAGNNSKYPIINAIVALANALEIQWIAEGIESAAQLNKLLELNCPFGQGYHLGKPMHLEQASQLVSKGFVELS